MRRLAALAIALALFAAPVLAAPNFPELTGRVVDAADIIPAAQEVALSGKLAALEGQTTDQFVVVTLPSLQGYDIADFGYQLGRAWQIGQADKDNGLLLIVAPDEREVRFEVGYGLEGAMTDALSRTIIEAVILPRFRDGNMAGGIADGVDSAIKVLIGDEAELMQLSAIAEQRPADNNVWELLPLLLFIIIVFLVIRTMGWRRGLLVLGSALGSSSSSRGSSWGGGSSGGGFRGGGGSFGGGGASGRW